MESETAAPELPPTQTGRASFVCAQCQQPFNRTTTYRRLSCKSCWNKGRRAARANDPEGHRRKDRERYAAESAEVHRRRRGRRTLQTTMLYNARSHAKSLGIDCSITVKDIVVPERCPVLGIELMVGGGRRTHRSPSLDRVNNALGYVPGNVCVISWRANDLKGSLTLEELRALLAYVENHRG